MLSLLDRLLGGIWGAGFESGVEAAFRFLVDNHEPGDEVFVFGFSRGAAQARALTHFLDWLGGLPAKGDAYFGPPLFLHWVQTRGRGDPNDVVSSDGRRPDEPMAPAAVRLLGVWDTVTALGPRLHIARGTSQSKWSFFVRPLPAACVDHARQALAVDERRFDYQPEIWTGCSADQTLEQRWFAGSQSNVGGGYVQDGLANIPFRWLVREAAALGLAMDTGYVKHYNPYPQARLYPSTGVLTTLLQLVRLRTRGGRRSLVGHPASAGLRIDRSLIHRIRSNPDGHDQLDRYRPENVLELLASRFDEVELLAEIGMAPDDQQLPDDVAETVRGLRAVRTTPSRPA